MARFSGKKRVSEETRAEAMKLAKGTRVPGQDKAQTRLIAQGIERGIDLYKKQHREKARAQDRRQRSQPGRSAAAPDDTESEQQHPPPTPRAQRLPWVLLALTWAGIGVYWVTWI